MARTTASASSSASACTSRRSTARSAARSSTSDRRPCGAPQRTGPVLLSGVPAAQRRERVGPLAGQPALGPVVDDGGEPGVAHGEVGRTQVDATVPQGAGSHPATRHATAVEDAASRGRPPGARGRRRRPTARRRRPPRRLSCGDPRSGGQRDEREKRRWGQSSPDEGQHGGNRCWLTERQDRYFSTVSGGRTCASDSDSPNSRLARLWRRRSQHWSSWVSSSPSR